MQYPGDFKYMETTKAGPCRMSVRFMFDSQVHDEEFGWLLAIIEVHS